MKSFEFIGIGGVTNIDLGGNCCYLREGDKLLLIDVCEETTKKLMKVGAFNGVKKLYIAITHTHYDHMYYYSGDTDDILAIRRMSGDPLIKRLYCEVRSKISNEHIYYGDVLDLDKKKLVLMHFNTVDLYQKAIEDGFMVAKLAQALV